MSIVRELQMSIASTLTDCMGIARVFSPERLHRESKKCNTTESQNTTTESDSYIHSFIRLSCTSVFAHVSPNPLPPSFLARFQQIPTLPMKLV